MKNAFVPYERHQIDGKLFTDDDGCNYLRPHTHPLLAGKEFCNQGELVTAIRDNNNLSGQKNDDGSPKAIAFKGEVILLNVITF